MANGAQRKKQETMWEFLKTTGPEDLKHTKSKKLVNSNGSIGKSSEKRLEIDFGDENAGLFDDQIPSTRKSASSRAGSRTGSQNRMATLTVDSDDEDAELFGKKPKKKEESMADFLRNTAPPERHEPLSTSIQSKKKSGAFGGLFSRKSVATTERQYSSAPQLPIDHAAAAPDKTVTGKKYAKLVIANDPYASSSNTSLNDPEPPVVPEKSTAVAARSGSQQKASTSRQTSSSRVNSSYKDETPRSSQEQLPARQKSSPKLDQQFSSQPQSRSNSKAATVFVDVPQKPRPKRPAPSTKVPEKFDDKTPLKKVFKNLTRIDTQFLNVFEAKIDVVFPPDDSTPSEITRKVFSKPEIRPDAPVKSDHAQTSSIVWRHMRTQTATLDAGESVSVQVDHAAPVQIIQAAVVKCETVDTFAQTDIQGDSEVLFVEVMPADTASLCSQLSMQKSLAMSDDEKQSLHQTDAGDQLQSPVPLSKQDLAVPDLEGANASKNVDKYISGIVGHLIEMASSMDDIDRQIEDTGAQTSPHLEARQILGGEDQECQAQVETADVSVQKQPEVLDVMASADTQVQTDHVQFVTEDHDKLSAAYDDVANECENLADECARLRDLLLKEKKKRQHIAEENAILRYRYEKLSRCAYSALVQGLERQLTLETELYEDSLI